MFSTHSIGQLQIIQPAKVKENGGWESRQFKINFNYRFGNNKVKQARQHKSSIEEENKRTQGGGGFGGQQQK